MVRSSRLGPTPETLLAEKTTAQLNARIAAITAQGGGSKEILSALGVKEPSPKAIRELDVYAQMAGGDYVKGLQLKRQADLSDKEALHQSIANIGNAASGLTPAQQRQLNADPEWRGLQTEQAALSRKLGEMDSDQFTDPDDMRTARANATNLQQKAQAVYSRVLGAGGPAHTPANRPSGAGATRMYQGHPYDQQPDGTWKRR